MRRDAWLYGSVAMTALLGAWVLFVGLPRWYPGAPSATPSDPAPGLATDGEFVDATLFFVSDDGMRLVEVDRRLEWRADAAAQARVILEAQLAEPPSSFFSPMPPGTGLRAIYLTERGDAFVDFTEEITLNHSGGSLDELFTVYAIVNALTANLPSITAVQLLVNGQELDTLVGHVDLRRPLAQNLQWIGTPENESTLPGVPPTATIAPPLTDQSS